jgi:hypothetical protein
MPRRVTVLAALTVALVATLGLTCQPADAFLRHRKVDPRIAEVSFGAGIVSTLAYWSALGWSWNKHSDGYKWGVWGATTAGCLVLSPMVAAAFIRERELTFREVWVMEGSCVIPIIGGWLVNATLDANPSWDPDLVVAASKAAAKKKKKK